MIHRRMPALLSLDLSCIIIRSFPDPKSSLPYVGSHVSVPISGVLISVAMSSLLNHKLCGLVDPQLHTQCLVCRKGSVDTWGKGPVRQWSSRCSSLPASLCREHYTTLRHFSLKLSSDHLIALCQHFQEVPISYRIQPIPLLSPPLPGPLLHFQTHSSLSP